MAAGRIRAGEGGEGRGGSAALLRSGEGREEMEEG